MKINYNNEDTVSHDGVAAIVKNQEGKILMQEHVKYGFWTIPVGKVKNNQTILDGLKQEIFEECNLEVLECSEITSKDYFYERDGNLVKVSSHLYEIEKYKGTIENKEPAKHRQQVFMSIQEIIELPFLSDSTLLYLNQIGINREPKI